jgi:ribonuclease HI
MGFSWEKKRFVDRKNADLWKRLLVIYRKHQVDFKWIKGIIIIQNEVVMN